MGIYTTTTITIDKPAPRENAEEHLSLHTLDAYHHHSLPEPERALVQHHIVLCRECRDLLLDLATFLEDIGAESRLWSAELTSVWEEWVATLEKRRTSET